MKIVIIGGGAGGLSTASNLRKYDESAQITVITRDENIAYSPCAIPYVLSGQVHGFKDIIMHQPEDYLEREIKVMTRAEVIGIFPENNAIKYKLLESDDPSHELSYDSLVIATGGTPITPLIEGTDLEGVFKIRTIGDGERIKKWAKKSKKAIVMGAGLIGLEMAYALKKMGLDVTLNEMLPQIVPRSLDPSMANIVKKYLENEGIKVILGKGVEKITGQKQVKQVIFEDESLDVDMIIMATGVRAETNLARMAGCELGRWAVKVNQKMQTTVPNLYAVGDCVEVVDAITGYPTQSPLGSTAVRQAKIAARNITSTDAEFKPVLNAMVSKIGELEFGSVGLTESFALQNGLEVICGKSRALTKARYYPGAKRIDVLMVCDLKGRIIGCQIIAKERVAERVDTMALAIAKNVTCQELSVTEFSYAPPVSMVIDPIILAAEDAYEKINNLNTT